MRNRAALAGMILTVKLVSHFETEDLDTALFLAAKAGHLDIMQILMPHALELQLQGYAEDMLLVAAKNGNLDMMRF